MSAQPPVTELTTRDVFQQVDRRLALIEADLRALDTKLDTKFHWMLGLLAASWVAIMATLVSFTVALLPK